MTFSGDLKIMYVISVEELLLNCFLKKVAIGKKCFWFVPYPLKPLFKKKKGGGGIHCCVLAPNSTDWYFLIHSSSRLSLRNSSFFGITFSMIIGTKSAIECPF